MKKIFLFASLGLLALTSCQKENDKKQGNKIFKGEVKTFQHGKAWTWYEVDESNNPLRMAIAIDDAAMSGLNRGHGNDGAHNHENSISLNLHPKAGATPFHHVMVDWNPAGHPPLTIYNKAHFDFHFYTTTEAERLAIPPYGQAPARFDNEPAAEYLPLNYIGIPEGVPQMGKHWVDITDPNNAPGGFNQSFLYGSYDGDVTFYEPMITEEFLLANPTFQRPIPVPAKFQVAGWYPTRMRIAKEGGATNIIMENFVRRAAN